MDITEFTKQTGNFLRAEDVKTNPVALWVICGEAKIETNKFGNERLHIPLRFGEKEWIFDASKTNAKFIEEQLGTTKTEDWVSCVLGLETYKTRTSDGTMTDAINVKSASKSTDTT